MKLELLLAFGILAGESELTQNEMVFFQPFVQEIAKKLQLSQDGDIEYYKNNVSFLDEPDPLKAYYGFIRRTYKECLDCPLVEDHLRWVYTPNDLWDMLQVNDKFAQYMGNMKELAPRWSNEIDDILSKNAEVRSIVYELLLSKTDNTHISRRRMSLREMRRLMGDYNYYSSSFLYAVPMWMMRLETLP